MDSSILRKAEKFLKEKSRRRRWMAAVSVLGVVVVVATALVLMAPARAMTESYCGLEEHKHSDECYEKILICGYPEEGAGESSEAADADIPAGTDSSAGTEGSGASSSGEAGDSSWLNENAVHVHNESCYQEERTLICEEAEREGHTHNDDCYTVVTEQALTCEQEESETHTHTEACYTEQPVMVDALVCGQEESDTHTHDESCHGLVPLRDLTCGQEEDSGHLHGDECYEVKQVLGCGMEETEGGEAEPTSAAVPEVPAEAGGEPAAAASEPAQTESGTMPETVEAGSESAAGATEETEPGTEASEPETEAQPHVHTDECYELRLICELEEHEHADKCYEKPELYCDEHLHVHDAECRDEEGNIICGYADFVVHTHDEKKCYGSKGTLFCPLPEIEEHIHTEECYEERTEEGKEPELVLICGKPEVELHTHDESCFNEEGALICGKLEVLEHVHNEECLIKPEEKPVETVETTFEGEGFVITASYEEDALPEGAVLRAEQITEESDPEHYAARQAQYAEIAGDESAPMQALLKIGFYVDEEEVEPGKPVVVTVQLLDENGMAEGEPITVIHFREEGAEQLEGSDAQNGSTTFEIGSFSEIAIGFVNKAEDKKGDGSSFYCVENMHKHTDDCLDENGKLICGCADFVVHVHDEQCYDAEDNRICPLPEIKVHTHTEDCYDGNDKLICGQEEIELHIHTAECYNENHILTCGKLEVLEHVHSMACKSSRRIFKRTCEGEKFTVTATYGAEANIPKQAELIAEQITAESDEEYYAKRQTEYQEALGDDEAVMRALLKIGFYVNGEEVEPESPVMISIQFLDEEGLLEGSPITIVHFTEENAGVLDGGKAADNTTTFRTDSFSEFAVGYGNGEGGKTVFLSDSFQYSDESMRISFYIEGEATVIGKEQKTEAHDENVRMVTSDNDPQMTLGIRILEEGEERYQTYYDYLENSEEQIDSLFLQVMSCRLFYGDRELDLSNCTVTAKVEPTKDLTESVQSAEPEEEGKTTTNYFSVLSLSPDKVEMQENAVEIIPEEKTADLSVECFLAAPAAAVAAESGIAEGAIEDGLGADGIAEGSSEKGLEANGIAEGETANGLTNGTAKDAIVSESVGNGIEGETKEGEAEADGTVENGGDIEIPAALVVKVSPNFIVQFYANLNVPESTTGTSGTTLPFIDTSKETGLGGLPKNGNKAPNQISLGLNTDGTVVFNIEPTVIYKQETKEFNPRLGDEFNIDYLNSLRDNGHYEIKELWVLNKREGETEDEKAERAASTEREDGNWTIYDLTNGGVTKIAFTNKLSLGGTKDEKGRSYIAVEEGTVMRFVYDPAEKSYSSKATFYDYDISNGSRTANPMETTNYGINSYFDSDAKTARFAFGNANMGTDFQNDTWQGNYLNKANKKDKNTFITFEGLTLELVKGMQTNDDGSMDVIFKDDVAGPSIGLFGNDSGEKKYEYKGEEGTGKTIYGNWNLNFKRQGDTFTLSSVSMSNDVIVASGLEKFGHPGKYNGTNGNKMIWTNHFWPLDQKWNDGQKTILDPMFGGKTMPKRSGGVVVPPSDDSIDHNSYFGMTYNVDFDLVEEYVGPLEYYFYGDDDMWVFLTDKETGQTTLVCDIGGVHSSVGEYVNLWDYIQPTTENGNSRLEHAKKQYSLSIFYTERGASGSSCWMQFTVPQISQIYKTPYDPDEASLTITKETVQFPQSMKDLEFRFTLRLSGIYNNYTVMRVGYETKFDENGNEVKEEKIIKEEKISAGEYPFKLKDGEYLKVIGLPIGTGYRVVEEYMDDVNFDTTVETSVSSAGGTSGDSGQAVRTVLAEGVLTGEAVDTPEGKKDKVDHVTVAYTNIYQYSLPETGGSGTRLYTIAGAISAMLGAGFLYRKKFRERRV